MISRFALETWAARKARAPRRARAVGARTGSARSICAVALSIVAAGVTVEPLVAQAPIGGSELLERAIRYHDPAGEWPGFAHALSFEERRPNGVVRQVQVTLDLPASTFVHESENEGQSVVRKVEGEECEFTVDGSRRVSRGDRERLNLECSGAQRSRNYYQYLWGLPMKLRDPGTNVDPEVRTTRFMDADVLALRVTYDEAVGSDIWYFYFDPETYRMTGYRFYHDEEANDGEYIVLDGEYQLSSMRIPRARSWYMNADERFLGEDVLVSHGEPDSR